MKKSTQELLDILKNTPAFSNYAEQEEAELIEVSLSDYLNRLIQAKIKTCLLSSEKRS